MSCFIPNTNVTVSKRHNWDGYLASLVTPPGAAAFHGSVSGLESQLYFQLEFLTNVYHSRVSLMTRQANPPTSTNIPYRH